MPATSTADLFARIVMSWPPILTCASDGFVCAQIAAKTAQCAPFAQSDERNNLGEIFQCFEERGRPMAPDLGRRLLAEPIGTALFVVFGAGAVVAALRPGNGKLDYTGLGIVAFSFALVIAMVIYAFGGTSGAHINPAVTLLLAVVRRFRWVEGRRN
jgi:hypothetical protein